MMLGTILSAMMVGWAFSVGVLIVGHPLWLALVVFSGGGVLFALLLILRLTRRSAFEDRGPLILNKG